MDQDCKDLATLIVLFGEADIRRKYFSAPLSQRGSSAGRCRSTPHHLHISILCSHTVKILIWLSSAWSLLHSLALMKSSGSNLLEFNQSTLGDARRDMEYKVSLVVFYSFSEDLDADRTDRAGYADRVNG